MPAQSQKLGKNPMLPGLPQTGELDSEYMSGEAILRQQVAQQYADVLQQLGYVDESGNFLPGSVSVNAARQQADLAHQSDLAEQQVTNESQQQGTLFSGYRGAETGMRQEPMQRQIAQIGVDTPLALGHLYEQAAGLVDQYSLQNNLLLAQMAGRRAAAIAAAPAGNQQQQEQTNATGPAGDTSPWLGSDYGQGANYNPTAPSGAGTYTQGGGATYYQSNKGKTGKKPMY